MCNFCETYKKAKEYTTLSGEKVDIVLKAEVRNVLPEGMRAHSHIEFDNIYMANYCPVCGRKLEG